MEYNLLKTIEPNLRLQMNPSTHPRLSQFPAVDFVNPGLGQVARLYSFYVPMQSNYAPLTINKKEDNSVNQEGSGKNEKEENEEVESEIETKDFDPLEYNNRKRKLLGEGVQSSFMNPMAIKTGTLQLEPSNKMKKKNASDISTHVKDKKKRTA